VVDRRRRSFSLVPKQVLFERLWPWLCPVSPAALLFSFLYLVLLPLFFVPVQSPTPARPIDGGRGDPRLLSVPLPARGRPRTLPPSIVPNRLLPGSAAPAHFSSRLPPRGGSPRPPPSDFRQIAPAAGPRRKSRRALTEVSALGGRLLVAGPADPPLAELQQARVETAVLLLFAAPRVEMEV